MLSRNLRPFLSMKGRDHFTEMEAAEIGRLLALVPRAEPGAPQKLLRDNLRAIGFYISDFAPRPAGFTVSDFVDLVRDGRVSIQTGRERHVPTESAPPGSGPTLSSDVPTRPRGTKPTAFPETPSDEFEALALLSGRPGDHRMNLHVAEGLRFQRLRRTDDGPNRVRRRDLERVRAGAR
jgi:hypothetical protein